MPTMTAAKAAALPATIRSRRRMGDVGCALMSSQRAVEHARSELDDSDDVDEQHQHAERERDGDRAGAPAPLLLRRQDDSALGLLLRPLLDHGGPHANTRCSTRSTANSTN